MRAENWMRGNVIRTRFITVAITTSAVATLICANPTSAQSRLPRWTITPDQTIDSDQQDLVPFRNVAVDAKGNVAILQPQDGAVRFFDVNGAPAGKVGRKGGGPGEFNSLSTYGWKGDTLWVYDSQQYRFTLITPGRKVARTITISAGANPPAVNPTGIPRFSFITPRRLEADGRIVARVEVGYSSNFEPPPAFTNKLTLARLAPAGTVQRIVAKFNTPQASAIVRGPDGKFVGNVGLPFVSEPMDAASPDGSRMIVVDAAVEGKDAGTFLITALTPTGQTVFARRHPFEQQKLSKHDSDSVINRVYTSMRKRSVGVESDLVTAYKREAHGPPMHPPLEYGGVIVGRDLTTWIAIKSADKQSRYYRIGADGALTGEVVLPKNARIAAADSRHIWVIEADEDDVQSLVRYLVAPPAPPKR